MLNNEEKKIDFGNKKVKKTEKQTLVNNVFNSVADKYDLMNDLTSLGIHRLWKDSLINWLAPQPYQKLADIAGGTGDISMKFLLAGGCSAHVIDINKEMITKGKLKNNNNNNLSWTIASAENLPMADNSYERASMGFGLRNITNRVLALKEVYRILKPGGRLICLEFSHVENSLLKKIYDVWSFSWSSIYSQIHVT